MNLLIYHFVSGQAFFSGMAVVVAGVTGSLVTARRRFHLMARLLTLCGAVMVALSATPLALWVYSLWLGLGGVWFGLHVLRGPRRTGAVVAGVAFAVLSVCLVVFEYPHHAFPAPPSMSAETVWVIGDSLSTGISPAERPWPSLLGERLSGVSVRNLAIAGATSGSAVSQARRIGRGEGLVLLEIGGNDLLGPGGADDFAERLETLLEEVQGASRRLVMFELPLPPFHGSYGRTQRKLARRYDAILIPRRCLASILMEPAMTVDGIHLSPRGHQALSQSVAQWLASGREAGGL